MGQLQDFLIGRKQKYLNKQLASVTKRRAKAEQLGSIADQILAENKRLQAANAKLIQARAVKKPLVSPTTKKKLKSAWDTLGKASENAGKAFDVDKWK